MSGPRQHVAREVRSATVQRIRYALLVTLSSLSAACADDARPDPPDMAGMGGEGDCPSGLPSEAACASSTPSYAREVAPIIEQRCATCHYAGNNQSGDVFADHGDVFSERQTVLTRIYTCAMPPEDAAPLTPAERRAVLQWFVCGAPEN